MNQEKIKEVALRVAREGLDIEGTAHKFSMSDFCSDAVVISYLTRCLQELSKDVEPVAWRYELKAGEYTFAQKRYLHEEYAGRPTPLYLHPPLTEQDKLDAERWRAYQKRKQDLLDRGFLRNPLRDETIDRAMENGK